jgi:hypothetical protein
MACELWQRLRAVYKAPRGAPPCSPASPTVRRTRGSFRVLAACQQSVGAFAGVAHTVRLSACSMSGAFPGLLRREKSEELRRLFRFGASRWGRLEMWAVEGW